MSSLIQLICFITSVGMAFFKGGDPCDIHVCLTWKILPNHLVLTCKVHDLHHLVIISDNFNQEQASCLPPTPTSSCHNEYENGTIYQKLSSKETIFDVRGTIDTRVNGNWTCRHGSAKDKAIVEVTIPSKNAVLKDADDNICMMKLISYTFMGYVSSLVLFVIFLHLGIKQIESVINKVSRKPVCCKMLKKGDIMCICIGITLGMLGSCFWTEKNIHEAYATNSDKPSFKDQPGKNMTSVRMAIEEVSHDENASTEDKQTIPPPTTDIQSSDDESDDAYGTPNEYTNLNSVTV